MQDKIEKIRNSTIQHGKFNNRIYLMELAENDCPDIINELDELAHQNDYTKIFAKVRETFVDDFVDNGYEYEALIPGFFENGDKAYFLGKFFDENRTIITNKIKVEKVIATAQDKKLVDTPLNLESGFEYRIATKLDVQDMVEIYKEVFPTYPFPIHDTDYIKKTMDENIIYFGIWKDKKLVALSSSEMDPEEKNVEMTDFATLPEYRGHGFALFLLDKMERKMVELGIQTFYTIARAVSFGMNITFAKMGYKYTGTLKNNTNISGHIESMNIWYKKAY